MSSMRHYKKTDPEMEKSLEASKQVSLLEGFILTSGNFFFHFRNALFPIIIVAVILLTRPVQFWGNPTLDRIVMGIGLLIALVGQSFRLLVIGFVYVKRGGKDGRIYAQNLVNEGFYAHTRNPMYVANFLIAVGFGMIYGAPQMYLLVIPFFVYVYLSITIAEERYLQQRFGEQYEEYVRKVNRFIPNFRGIRESLKWYRYDWKRAMRKEYGTLCWTLAGMSSVYIWKVCYLYGFAAREKEIMAISGLMVVLFLLYFLFRYLKFTKQLR